MGSTEYCQTRIAAATSMTHFAKKQQAKMPSVGGQAVWNAIWGKRRSILTQFHTWTDLVGVDAVKSIV